MRKSISSATYLRGGELVAEGHEGVSEGLGVDLAVDLESLNAVVKGLGFGWTCTEIRLDAIYCIPCC